MEPLTNSTNSHPPVLAAVFDLDGTLADSQLDFQAIRNEMDLQARQPVLEALQDMPPDRRQHCQAILKAHEQAGAERATPISGAADFVGRLQKARVRCAVVTRNSRPMALAMLSRLSLHFEILIAREDGPVKPDPWAILSICRDFKVPVQRAVMIGDYLHDIECGRRAGCRTVLLTHGRNDPHLLAANADFELKSFEQSEALISWLGV